MIEMTFRSAGGPILVQLAAPVATPEAEWPWTVEVRLDGRPSTVVGWDLLGTMNSALYLLSGYLCEREGLEPAVLPLPLMQTLDVLAQGFRDGLLAVLEVRGIACSDAARERIATCSDPAVLRTLLAHAKTAASVEEVLASMPAP